MNATTFLFENVDDTRTALITQEGEFTYRDLKKATACLAERLQCLGVSPGDRVAILAPNSLFWVASYLAAMLIDAIAVPYSTLSTVDEFEKRSRYAPVKAYLITRKLASKFADFLDSSAQVVLEDSLDIKQIPDDVLKNLSQFSSNPDISGRDASLMFTSGTTAKSKAVRVTHQNIQANTRSIISYLDLKPEDRMMVVLPFYYCFGLSLLHTHLRAGASLVLNNRFVFPEVVLDQMEATSVTSFAGVPSTFQTLLRNSSFKKREWKNLRKIQQAGGKLSPILIEELADSLPEAKIFIMYGQTEATARLSYLPPELLKAKLGSIGRGIPGVELRVLGEDGQPVEPGEVGEIYARGENITPGYLDNPGETDQKYSGGVLHTGDLATVDEDGYIYIVDRASDFMKPYGFRVSSQQIEACVMELPQIVSAAAISQPDLASGEAIHVFITQKTGQLLEAKDVIAHCRQRLAAYMVPKEIHILESLPLNENGKVMKPALRKMLEKKDEQEARN